MGHRLSFPHLRQICPQGPFHAMGHVTRCEWNYGGDIGRTSYSISFDIMLCQRIIKSATIYAGKHMAVRSSLQSKKGSDSAL